MSLAAEKEASKSLLAIGSAGQEHTMVSGLREEVERLRESLTAAVLQLRGVPGAGFVAPAAPASDPRRRRAWRSRKPPMRFAADRSRAGLGGAASGAGPACTAVRKKGRDARDRAATFTSLQVRAARAPSPR